MTMDPTRFWQRVDDKRVLCQLCPRECLLSDGQRGFCFGRMNVHGQLVLSSYGRSSGVAVDPIEKKPLYHFYPGSRILSFGTIGCNLGCRFCQNWHISRAKSDDLLSVKASPEDIAHEARESEVPVVAFTYNEPIVFAEYAIDTAIACHKLGIKTVAVTAGYISDKARPEFFKHIDAANVDFKSFRDDFYQKFCDGRLQPVLDTLLYLNNDTDVWLEVTNLIIPGENDSKEEIGEMVDWIADNLGVDVPVHFSAFHPDYHMKDSPRTGAEILSKARAIAMKAGLRYVYTGNVDDDEGSVTICPGCKKILVRRDGFEVVEYNIKGSACAFCGVFIAGKF